MSTLVGKQAPDFNVTAVISSRSRTEDACLCVFSGDAEQSFCPQGNERSQMRRGRLPLNQLSGICEEFVSLFTGGADD